MSVVIGLRMLNQFFEVFYLIGRRSVFVVQIIVSALKVHPITKTSLYQFLRGNIATHLQSSFLSTFFGFGSLNVIDVFKCN